MKHFYFIAILVASLFSLNAQSAFKPTKAQTLSIDTAKSSLKWVGEKYTIVDSGSRHNGTVNLKSGDLTVVDGKITGGTFVIDMNSMKNLDLKKDGAKAKLVGHLMSDDFFAVKKFPTATFVISGVKHIKGNQKEVSGILKIRDVAKPEKFMATVSKDGKSLKASGEISFNRRDYGVNFHSESDFFKKVISVSKDKIIKDIIKINLDLVTRPTA